MLCPKHITQRNTIVYVVYVLHCNNHDDGDNDDDNGDSDSSRLAWKFVEKEESGVVKLEEYDDGNSDKFMFEFTPASSLPQVGFIALTRNHI